MKRGLLWLVASAHTMKRSSALSVLGISIFGSQRAADGNKLATYRTAGEIHEALRLFHEAQLRRNPTYSRRRSVSIAALSAGSATPSSLACPHLTGRRLDGCEVGHFEQASTSRSSTSDRCLFAHRWQAIRSVKTFGDMTKTRPDRSQPWKCFSSPMCEM